MVLAMLAMLAMLDMVPTPMPTTARDLLTLSLRLRLMPRLTLLFSTAPTDIPMPVPMVPTPLPTDMDTEPLEPTPILTTARGLLMLSPRLMPTMVLMAMASPMLDMAMPVPTPMVPTLMLTDFMASKMSPASV